MPKILVIDDERSIRGTLKDILEFEKHKVTLAENGRKGLAAVESGEFDLIFSDVKMPEMDGLEFLTKVREMNIETPVVMISGHGNIETAVECIKIGAFDFIEKPIDLNRLLVVLRNAIDSKNLVSETKRLRNKIDSQNQMIGQSAAIKKVMEMIERVAPTDARVLITGENGTGKELVAQLLYKLSNRAEAPFVEVNCAAIPSELIESELFGHEKGAFTSAVKQRTGKFEQADGGTIFLDEIGDMSLSAQTKVLRVLQESELTRVGSDKVIKVNVRVFAATNKDLKKEIEKGNFREDLFHRLNVIPIHVPTLEQRREDINLLISHFCQLICEEMGIALKTFSNEAIKILQMRTWRGNIRELRNVVERLIILSGNPITAKEVEDFAMF
ncbi:MAG: sigma-54 dependent transcriptional regulator [Prevotellaceae bacterium]|jgi:DNA-binding NtrC family response regulator|nr:sigma-54 dependent transcriptional regulator [Prevotellaceae bacterium]